MTDSTAQAIKTPLPTPNRPISKLLGWAIFVAPYLFAWLTLRGGTSKRARILSFSWMTFFVGFTAVQEFQGKGVLSRTRRNLMAVPASNDASEQAKDRPSPPPIEGALAQPAEEPTRPVTHEELRKRLADLRKASKESLYDLSLPTLHQQIALLNDAERKSLGQAYRDLVKRASAVKSKYVMISAQDADRIPKRDLRETALESLTKDLEGAEGDQADKARARLAESRLRLDQERAKAEQLRTQCGRTVVGKHSVTAFLRSKANDPKGIDVQHCSAPVLTDQCWQIECEFLYKNAFGATMRQTANFYAQGNTIVSSDAQ